MTHFETILVPTDFSDHSNAALDMAVEFAKSFGAKIHLLHCYPLDPTDISPYGDAASASPDSRIRDSAERRLKESEEKLQVERIASEISLTSEFPSEAIAKMAQEIGADLIVMGTRGIAGLKHVMLGSVAERTVRLARCPVLTVRAPEPN
jgi:nucleotide-binding universal stress UspA family protein